MLIFSVCAFSVFISGCHTEKQEPVIAQNWTLLRSALDQTLTDISFVSADTGYVWGENNILLQSTDGGQTWATIPMRLPATSVLSCFAATQNQTLYAARDTLYTSTDGGKNWVKVVSDLNGRSFRKLFFTSVTDGYAICADGIYTTTSAGQSWKLQKYTPTGYYDGIWLSNDVAYIIGGELVDHNASQYITSYGLLVRTDDGGQTWTDFTKGHWIDNTQNFKKIEALSFINPSYGYMTDAEGKLLRTTDGGNSWTIIQTLPGIASQLLFTDEQTGYVLLGGRIYSIRDAKATLTEEFTGQQEFLRLSMNPFSKKLFLVGRNGEIAIRK